MMSAFFNAVVTLILMQSAGATPPEHRASNCGIGCVYIALKLHNFDVTTSSLVHEAGTFENDGIKLGKCRELLEDHGLVTREIQFVNREEILNLPIAAILPVHSTYSPRTPEPNHFVLFIKGDADNRKIFYCSPTEYYEQDYTQFARNWDGECLIVAKDNQELQNWIERNRANSTPMHQRLLLSATLIISALLVLRYTKKGAKRA